MKGFTLFLPVISNHGKLFIKVKSHSTMAHFTNVNPQTHAGKNPRHPKSTKYLFALQT